MERKSDEEISLYDIADWLWSYRYLALIVAVLGALGATVSWLGISATPTTYTAAFTVYSSGTPVRSAAEIVEILQTKLSSEGAVASSAAANRLVVPYATSGEATAAKQVASALEQDLVAEVENQRAAAAPLIDSNERALDVELKAASFLSGYQSGLIKIVQSEVEENVGSSGSTRGAVLSLVASGMLFFLIAGAHSFWRNWRARGSASVR